MTNRIQIPVDIQIQKVLGTAGVQKALNDSIKNSGLGTTGQASKLIAPYLELQKALNRLRDTDIGLTPQFKEAERIVGSVYDKLDAKSKIAIRRQTILNEAVDEFKNATKGLKDLEKQASQEKIGNEKKITQAIEDKIKANERYIESVKKAKAEEINSNTKDTIRNNKSEAKGNIADFLNRDSQIKSENRQIEKRIRENQAFIKARNAEKAREINSASADSLSNSKGEAKGLLEGILLREAQQNREEQELQKKIRENEAFIKQRRQETNAKSKETLNESKSEAKENMTDFLARNTQIGKDEKEGTRDKKRLDASLAKEANEYNRVLQKLEANSLKVASATDRSTISIKNFAEASALATKRFLAFLGPTSILFGIFSLARQGVDDALQFEATITKIQQTLGESTENARALGKEIRAISSNKGVSAQDLAKSVQFFSQAGFTDQKALLETTRILSDVPLAATFDDLPSTTEGLLAIFSQFNLTLTDTASILDTISQYSNDFAAESRDLFEIIKRSGSAFASLEGGGEEGFLKLIKLASILRSSTRESAETLGVFFKSGLTRLTTPESRRLLQSRGLEGGDITETLGRLGNFFNDDKEDSVTKINLARDLAGVLQFNRLIALSKGVANPDNQQKLISAEITSQGSLERQAVIRSDDLGQSLERLRQQINTIIDTIINDSSIKTIFKTLADLGQSFTSLSGVLGPVVNILSTILVTAGASKLTEFSKVFAGRFVGSKKGIQEVLEERFKAVDDILGKSKLGSIQLSSVRDAERARISQNTVQEFAQRKNPPVSGLGIGITAAAFIAGEVIKSPRFNRNIEDGLTNTQVGDAIQASTAIGLLGKAISGSGLIGSIAALGFGIFNLVKDIEENRRQLVTQKIGEAKTVDQLNQINKKFNISSGIQKNSLTDGRFNTKGNNFFRAIRSLFDFSDEGQSKILNEGIDESLFTGRSTDGLGNVFSQNKIDIDKNRTNLLIDKIRRKDVNDPESKELNEFFEQSFKLFQTDFVKEKGINAFNKLKKDRSSFIDQFGSGVQEIAPNFTKNESVQIATILFDRLIKKTEDLQKKISDFLVPFDAFADSLTSGIDKLMKAFKKAGEDAQNNAFLLNSVVTSPNDFRRSLLNENPRNLINSAGTPDAVKQSFDLVENISNIFDQTLTRDIKKALVAQADVSFNTEEGPIQNDIENFFKDFDTQNNSSIKALQSAIAQIQSFNPGTSLKSIIESITSNKGSNQDLVENLLPNAKKVQDLFVENQKKVNEEFNKYNDTFVSLSQSSANANQSIYDLSKQIESLYDSIQDRSLEQSQFEGSFSGNLSERGAAGQQADLASRRAAFSRFGNTNSFLSNFSSALTERNRTRGEADSLNRTAPGSDASRQAVLDATDAQLEFSKLQQEFNNRMNEFNVRISDAAKASDTLKQALLGFKAELISAGNSITQVTQRDFATGLNTLSQAFAQFQSGGLTALDQFLGNLSPEKFKLFEQLLNTAGEVDLGGGLTGKGLLDQLSLERGIATLGAVRSRNTGETQTQAEDAIRKQFQDLQDQQKQAAAEEIKLRNEQIKLFEGQQKNLSAEAEYYEKAKVALEGIYEKLKEIDIKKLSENLSAILSSPVSELTGSEVKNVETLTAQERSANSLNKIESSIREKLTDNIPLMSGDLSIIREAVVGIRGMFDKIMGEGVAQSVKLEVSPIQVNVALSAPDILKLAGESLYKSIMGKVGPAIAEALGVISEEAKSTFESRVS